MAIKALELARVKTSGEDVFILALSTTTATVRRPTGTTDGIKHVVEDFLLQELETPDEARTREMAERFSLQQKFSSLQQPESSEASTLQ